METTFDPQTIDLCRRHFLTSMTSGLAVAGAGTALVPFVLSMNPSAKKKMQVRLLT